MAKEILKVDDKWSIAYDPENNDRPLQWLRHGELCGSDPGEWSDHNGVTAMFYTLLEQSRKASEAKFEAAWREMHGKLDWMQGHKSLNKYLGQNFADVANDLIDKAYPGLRDGGALVKPTELRETVQAVYEEGMKNHNTRCKSWWSMIVQTIKKIDNAALKEPGA